MAYNERLAERIRIILRERTDCSERRMFGGVAFLLDGKMCVGVVGDDLIVRAGTERYAAALSNQHARPMDFTGRPMRGWVYVAPAGVSRGPSLQRWIEMGIACAEAATPSTRKKPARR